jgi:hypothetical protein
MTFAAVRRAALALPGVESVKRRYDGAPVLKLHGCFMAGVASHESAEPDSLVVRCDVEQRALLLEDAPETYYVTGFYERYPLVLARLSRLHPDALHDLLSITHRLTLAKTGRRRRT